MSIEVMKQALEALKANQPINFCLNSNNERFPIFTEDPFRFERNEKAMDLLRQAIERVENNVLAEREACAEVCESEAAKLSQSRDALAVGICAAAIRARGEARPAHEA